MYHIVYLHGLGSSSLSSTPKFLQQAYSKDMQVTALELYAQCGRSLSIINDYLREHQVDAVIGTSLGGFFALACAFDGIKIAVNPALHPERDLNRPDMLGTHSYFLRRKDRKEKTYTLTERDLQEYAQTPLRMNEHTFLVQSSHDETLGDYTEEGMELLKQVHEGPIADIFQLVTDQIGHRLNKEFLVTEPFYSLLCAAFNAQVYPDEVRRTMPDPESPF